MSRLLSAAAVLWASCAPAAVIGTSVAAEPLTAERVARLAAAQRKPWLEYLERSKKQEEADRAALDAELKKAGMKQALVPPNGSAARSLPLNRPAEWYAGAEARRIADIVVSFQTPAGGWSKNLNQADHVRRPGESFAPNNLSQHLSTGDFDTPHHVEWNYVGTLDNDATTTEMRFLAKVAAAAGAGGDPYRKSFLRGVEYLLAAQFPTGGWPQVWPLEGGYHDAITFNDGAVIHAIELLRSAGEGKDEFSFVPPETRARTEAAVERAIECILATQIVATGRRTVWAQQHDALTLKPVAGRNYEPAAQCASESAEIVRFLQTLPASAGVQSAVDAAIAWFRKTAVYGKAYTRGPDGRKLVEQPGAGPIWARFYEIGTDRPIFGDRDKSLHDDVNEISAERRNGYSWYNTAPLELIGK